jgi:hypothetical protein
MYTVKYSYFEKSHTICENLTFSPKNMWKITKNTPTYYTQIENSFFEFVRASKDASYSYQCEILKFSVDFVCFLHCLNFF